MKKIIMLCTASLAALSAVGIAVSSALATDEWEVSAKLVD